MAGSGKDAGNGIIGGINVTARVDVAKEYTHCHRNCSTGVTKAVVHTI